MRVYTTEATPGWIRASTGTQSGRNVNRPAVPAGLSIRMRAKW
jgi:hypothetical protein